MECRVRPAVTSAELNALYAVAWPEHGSIDFGPVLERSLTHVCAYEGGRLIGSV